MYAKTRFWWIFEIRKKIFSMFGIGCPTSRKVPKINLKIFCQPSSMTQFLRFFTNDHFIHMGIDVRARNFDFFPRWDSPKHPCIKSQNSSGLKNAWVTQLWPVDSTIKSFKNSCNSPKRRRSEFVSKTDFCYKTSVIAQ